MIFETITPGWYAAWIVLGTFFAIALLSVLGAFLHQLIYARVYYPRKFARYMYLKQENDNKRNRERILAEKQRNQASYVPYYTGVVEYHRPVSPEPKAYRLPYWIVAISFGVIALVMSAIVFPMMSPYNAKYWSWYTTTGEITSIQAATTVTSDGDSSSTSLTQDFIVHISSTPHPIYMNDQRVRGLLHSRATLLCGVSWNSYGHAADTWSCDLKSYPGSKDAD